MSFCTKCGRQRKGSARFCAGCGAEFRDPAVTETRVTEEAPADIALITPPLAEEATRWDQPAAEPAATQQAWAGSMAPAFSETGPMPPPRTEPPAPLPPPYPAFAPSTPVPVPTSRRGKRTAIIIATVVAALAAGGGAFALVSSGKGHTAAGPSTRPTVKAASQPATPTPTPSPSATPSASLTPTPTPTPSPSHSPGAVSVAPGVAANPLTPKVEAILNDYFNAINTRNYSEYNSLHDAQMQAQDTPASFDSGFATTKDSAETLTSISDTGGGGVAATVSFTSHQSPADSIDHSSCNDWQLTLYLVPRGSSYVITAAPSGYQPTYSDC